ncbi:hypothetical protein M514_07353 [Trichuris suis]|uniref:Uncharacterized protein n=1 Tax=Trichuris suis TaxID=68888 RepID=A0A085M3N0_9BILA|nr:hypothetical protein M513_07353 [Trichuris suis]KFD68368.1 hypothetical protein M514_07353 [Trichuris suis]KHJ47728.1 hypothetical protein D918_01885 [Trichuris suis]
MRSSTVCTFAIFLIGIALVIEAKLPPEVMQTRLDCARYDCAETRNTWKSTKQQSDFEKYMQCLLSCIDESLTPQQVQQE